ncbi:conserved hypothetical protein [Ricinus communis]|uniref:Uncharacterized protein n=1 Tax=Ricinus communis TaxID=3988 RepID=B9SCU7_RICCO|nr:conserved hypothetical protein [Ricinus communis]
MITFEIPYPSQAAMYPKSQSFYQSSTCTLLEKLDSTTATYQLSPVRHNHSQPSRGELQSDESSEFVGPFNSDCWEIEETGVLHKANSRRYPAALAIIFSTFHISCSNMKAFLAFQSPHNTATVLLDGVGTKRIALNGYRVKM